LLKVRNIPGEIDSPSLNSNNQPGWCPRLMAASLRASTPDIYEQGPIEMTSHSVIERAQAQKRGISRVWPVRNQFTVKRPGGHHIDPEGRFEQPRVSSSHVCQYTEESA
jgi:hypothetical protein